MNPTLGYAAAICTVVIWGFVVIPVKNARTPGQLGIAVSMPCGLLGLCVAALFVNTSFPSLSSLFSPTGLFIVLAGVCEYPLSTICYYESIQRCELSLAAPLTRMKIIFVALLVLLLGIEGISLRVGAACVLGGLGAFVLTYGRPAAHQLAGRKEMRTGIILALMAALFWALGDIFMRYALKSVQVLPVTLLSLVAGMAGFYIYLIARGRVGEVARMPRHDKLMYVCHGLVSFGLGYYLFYYAIQNVGVTRAAVITAGWPLVAFFIGLSLYGEKLSRTKAIGVALIMLSVFLAIE